MSSRSFNQVILLGNLGRDAETKYTPGGIAKTAFSIATSQRWKDKASGDWKEEVHWHNIVLWRAEKLAEYLTKGQQVHIVGRLSNRSYEKDGEKKYITEVVAESVLLCGGRRDDGQPVSKPRSAQSKSAAEPDGYQGGESWSDDDVPF